MTAQPRPAKRRIARAPRKIAAARATPRPKTAVPKTVTAEQLMAEAEIARTHAYAPYSQFRVGAALLTADGDIFHGCNVENASLGLSICAERNAMWKAVSEGVRDFVAVAVTADHGASPCGACRQVLHEFAPHLRVYWRDGTGEIATARIEQLLAHPFSVLRRKRS